ncbi:hypothetical protein KNV09_gp164 [Vibrio phage Athena]|uniref:Uncharacterized protein n=9 Tax=Thalassavirus TaxID=2948922 RepID=A0A6M9Z0L6_9CAUD|nr:hypothetical protein KNU88_gp162 [Vibrio phage Chester]YP_010108168.1 hypothetical protein KNV06_gp161 [Vibrio phage AG74]YP_010108358.1 hypothetical protein KNV07_gp164 [Vibrio phage Cody]YP_010108746.1 hypothetical protein KNV09_gp164 [Vibrio phage Athena]YP_010114298.1 hypothetical protein KNV71_gp168 [Vibrio phage Gary]QIG66245.1 hypothetical protein CILSICK_146 [Vibrio phage Cilsick]QQO89763.1 hypothetical protein GRLPWR_149 [Vibrio phage GRLPWR]WBF69496.1 hypothetical protein IW18_1
MGCSWKSLCKSAIILATITATSVSAAGLIPSPELPYGNDSIRTPDGFQCSSAIAPSAYMDAGVYQEDDNSKYGDPDRGVYVRIMVPLYSGTKRLDCSQLYKQALKERQREQALSNIKDNVFKSNN